MLYFLRSLVYLLFSIFPLALLGKSDPHPGLPPFILQLANHIHELHILLFFVVFIETRSHEAGLELMILLPQPPECWDYRCAHQIQLKFSDLTNHKSKIFGKNCIYTECVWIFFLVTIL
jgi:hypothetical protein